MTSRSGLLAAQDDYRVAALKRRSPDPRGRASAERDGLLRHANQVGD